ncbi:hypothetical protein C8R46DRAFT_375561 [Mycena filopes]|nr:hypothetical protein C8R46DRAFT_375561 [Mycena filopes]
MASSICETCGASQTAVEDASRLPPTLAFTPPELTSLLTSNDPPLDSEIPRILDIISVGQDRIDSLDPQIHALQSRLALLVQERDETAKCVREHRAIVSSLRRVPPEVLCEIFALSIDSLGEREEPPWYLGHICRTWRCIALAYPRLWTRLTIREDLPRIEEQLLRAGNALLDVYWLGRLEEPRNHALSELLMPHYARWSTLHIDYYIFDDNHAPEWLRLANGHLDQLTNLELTHSGFEQAQLPIFLSTAPKLRRVLLNSLEFSEGSPWFPIPWPQITHYRGTFRPHRQVEILQAAQNLQVCSVGFMNRSFDPPLAPLVTPPHLRRFSTEWPEFLSYLTAPALQELTSLHTESEATPLLLFISTSRCVLTTLALFGCSLNAAAFLLILHTVPSLTHLFVECERHPSPSQQLLTTIFNTMTLSTSPLLCPSLTSLVYGYWGPAMAPEQAFFDMARSRFRRPRGLDRLCIFAVNGIPPPEQLAADIAALRADGFDAAFLDVREARELRRSYQF